LDWILDWTMDWTMDWTGRFLFSYSRFNKFSLRLSLCHYRHYTINLTHLNDLRGGPLEIPGGGWKFPPKNLCKEKCLEKNLCSHYVREKKFVQANSKVQIVLKKIRAEVKGIKKIPAETWDWK
jgi:hypothetical protein